MQTTINKWSVPNLVKALGSDFGIKIKSVMINGLLKDYCHAKKNGSEYFISNSFYSNETEQPMHKTLNKRSKLIVREELLLY